MEGREGEKKRSLPKHVVDKESIYIWDLNFSTNSSARRITAILVPSFLRFKLFPDAKDLAFSFSVAPFPLIIRRQVLSILERFVEEESDPPEVMEQWNQEHRRRDTEGWLRNMGVDEECGFMVFS